MAGSSSDAWPWSQGGQAPHLGPLRGHFVPWAWKWPPPWWPNPLVNRLCGSVRVQTMKQHDSGRFFGAKEAAHVVRSDLSRLPIGMHFSHRPHHESRDRCLILQNERPCGAVLGADTQKLDREVFDRPLFTESNFRQPSTTKVNYLSLLNWNAGNLHRNTALIDFICGNFSLALIQEASTTKGQALAASRGTYWSDTPDGEMGCLSVVAGASGNKVVLPTYGLTFDGKILRPHKEDWKQGDRLFAAYLYTADVAWQNAAGELVKRAGLESWRVTTFHMDHEEAKKAGGSGRMTLEAALGLAMRDKHRVFAGDFNQAHHYIQDAFNQLVRTHKEYADITCEVLEGPSPEIRAIIFNYPRSVQLTGEAKNNSFRKGSSFLKAINLSPSDKDAHYPQVLYIYEKELVSDLTCRKRTHQRSAEEKKRQNRKKRARAKPKAQAESEVASGLGAESE